MEVRVSGTDASVIEETYAWMPERNSGSGTCPRFSKTVTRRTRIAKSGVLYESKQVDTGPLQQSRRPLRPNEVIYISNIQTVPRLGDPSLQLLGTDTIAGQPCRRVASKQIVAGAGSYDLCIFVAPANCRVARYLQPLEMSSKSPEGKVIWHGRTTSLRYGGRGQVVSPDSIRAP